MYQKWINHIELILRTKSSTKLATLKQLVDYIFQMLSVLNNILQKMPFFQLKANEKFQLNLKIDSIKFNDYSINGDKKYFNMVIQ